MLAPALGLLGVATPPPPPACCSSGAPPPDLCGTNSGLACWLPSACSDESGGVDRTRCGGWNDDAAAAAAAGRGATAGEGTPTPRLHTQAKPTNKESAMRPLSDVDRPCSSAVLLFVSAAPATLLLPPLFLSPLSLLSRTCCLGCWCWRSPLREDRPCCSRQTSPTWDRGEDERRRRSTQAAGAGVGAIGKQPQTRPNSHVNKNKRQSVQDHTMNICFRLYLSLFSSAVMSCRFGREAKTLGTPSSAESLSPQHSSSSSFGRTPALPHAASDRHPAMADMHGQTRNTRARTHRTAAQQSRAEQSGASAPLTSPPLCVCVPLRRHCGRRQPVRC